MTGVVAMPAGRFDGPDGRRFVYVVEGARVTFEKPATPADLEAAAQVVRAGRRALLEMISQAVDEAGDVDPRDLDDLGGGGHRI